MRAIGRMSPYTVHLGADVFLLALSGSVIKLNKMRQDASYANVPFPLVLYRSCGNCHGQSRVLLLVPYTVVGTNRAKQHPWGSAVYIAEIASQKQRNITLLRIYHRLQSVYFVFSTSATCLPTDLENILICLDKLQGVCTASCM
jgi:hypothetical protein